MLIIQQIDFNNPLNIITYPQEKNKTKDIFIYLRI